MSDPQKRVIFANLVDTKGDGKINMVSFLDEKGSIGLAVDTQGNGVADHVYVFQDVTGDGKLDADDELFIREKANELLASADVIKENPLLIHI